MEDVINVSDLTKSFGSLKALDGLNLSVERGTINGFLSPNGAGKTTALKIIVGLMRPDAGRVSVFGHDSTGHGWGGERQIKNGLYAAGACIPPSYERS